MRYLAFVFSGIIFILMAFIAQGYAKINLPEVAGVWFFDEKEGNIVNDSSGNENHGKFNGTLQWTKEGVFGGALNCGNQGHVLIQDSDTLDLDKEWTLTTWVRINPPMTRWQHIINKRLDLEDNYAIRLQDIGSWEVYVNNGGWVRLGDPSLATGGEWVHLAATYDGKSILTLYVNGEQVATRVGVAPPPVNDVDLRFGAYQGNSGGMDGMIDDTAIFAVALSPEEIESIKEKGLAVVLNLYAIDPVGKLPTTWGDLKR